MSDPRSLSDIRGIVTQDDIRDSIQLEQAIGLSAARSISTLVLFGPAATQIRPGMPPSIQLLLEARDSYVRATNTESTPFALTKALNLVMTAYDRARAEMSATRETVINLIQYQEERDLRLRLHQDKMNLIKEARGMGLADLSDEDLLALAQDTPIPSRVPPTPAAPAPTRPPQPSLQDESE